MDVVRVTVLVGKAMEHGSHPPGEALALPDAAQATLGVILQALIGIAAVKIKKGAGPHANISDREVQSFRAGGRNDVRGVAEQEKIFVLHGFSDEAAHRRDSLLENRAVAQNETIAGGHAQA